MTKERTNMGRDSDKSLEERVDHLANVVFALQRTIKEELIPQLADFSTTADVQERVDAVGQRQSRFTVIAAILVLCIAVAISVSGYLINSNLIHKQNQESQKRVKAFCGLVYLFDQSIKIQGNKDLGPLQAPYDQWKKDVSSAQCPKKPDVVVNH